MPSLFLRRRLVHAVAEKGFAADPGLYDAVRPSYPSEAIDCFLEKAMRTSKLTSVAEINCLELAAGTGKLSRKLLSHGIRRLTPTEPVREMREQFHPKEMKVLQATAENLSQFDDNSFDLVAVGQAFHWFANMKALNEIARVLRKPGGTLALIWNLEADDKKWIADLRRIWEAYDTNNSSGDLPQYRKGTWLDCFFEAGSPFYLPERMIFQHTMPTTPEEIWLRAKSKSYIAALSSEEQATVRTDIMNSLETSIHSGLVAFDQVRDGDGQLVTALPLVAEVLISTPVV